MKKILCIAFLLLSIEISAQYQEALSTDRPGQSTSASTVGKNIFQIQTGLDFFEGSSQYFPSTVLRYGLSEKFEINSGIILGGNNFANEITSFTLGARYVISKLDQKSKSSIQLSQDFGAVNNSTLILYNFESLFTDRLSYTLNIGYNFNELSNFGLYIFSVSYMFNDKLGFFVEPFGTFTNDEFQTNFDTGAFYNVSNDFQLDATIGYNNAMFYGVGFTWRTAPFRK